MILVTKNLYLSNGYGARRLFSWKLGISTPCKRKSEGRVRLISNHAAANRVLCVSTRTLRMSKTLCSVKTHRSICEISRETSIHRLTVHRIIHRDVQLNCVKELMRKEILLLLTATFGIFRVLWFFECLAYKSSLALH